MGIPLFQVDAFTNEPFTGNPAAVCLLPKPRETAWMQQVAQEMNLSETAFLYRQQDVFHLRWFTPSVEVDLCGHATLASAHVLWEEGEIGSLETARFETRSGLLTASRNGSRIELDFPSEPESPVTPPPELVKALDIDFLYTGKNRFDYLVEADSEKTIRLLKPDLSLLATLPIRGVMVTSRASSGRFDFVSRFFGPGAGIPEDPVTGSAHCCLGPFWGKRLNKTEMAAYQASPRGGTLHVRLGDGRVHLGGEAVTVFRGELMR